MLEQAWKILLIDDDEDDYLLTRTMLSEAQGRKFQLEWAGSFEAGLAALGMDGSITKDFQAVLVDYDLGVRSGVELISQASAANYPAPLILFTGRGSYQVDLEAMQAGATLYLTKEEANPLLLERAIRYAVEIKQKAREVREREAILESVLESANGAVWAVDREYRLIMANKAFYESAERRLGRPIAVGEWMIGEKVVAEGGSTWRALYDQALGGETVRKETEERNPSGQLAYFEYALRPILDHDGQVTGAACFCRDITEIRMAQVELVDFLENTHDIFFSLDRAWRITYTNHRWTEISGRSAAELIGQNFWEAFPRYLGTRVEQYYHQAMEQRVPVYFESIGYYSKQWHDISIYPTRNGISVFASDRTQEKQALESLQKSEAELRESEAELRASEGTLRRSESRYRAFFENLRDLVQVLELVYDDSASDANARIPVDWIWRDANQPALAVLGASREEVIGARAMQRLDPDFVRGLLPYYSNVIRTGEPLEYEVNYFGRDYLVSVFRMEENLLGSSATDITDRKQVERLLRERNAALRLSETRLRHLFDTSIIGIMNRDLAGNIFDANDAFLGLLGYTREAFLSVPRNINDLIPEEYHPVEEQIVAEVLATGASKPHEKELIRADGERIPVLVGHTLLSGLESSDHVAPADRAASSLLRKGMGTKGNAADSPILAGQPDEQKGQDILQSEIIGFVVDLTELKAAQQSLEEYAEKLKRSNHELEQFAFIASHDLQEPLRKIQSFGEILERDLTGKLDDRAADHLDRMRSAAGRMQEMVRDLLELSRVHTRGQPFVTVNLNETAEEVVSDLGSLIERSGGSVILHPLPTIQADPLQMRQLLQNLIGNALKFHKPGEPPQVVVGSYSPEQKDGQKPGRVTGPLRLRDTVTFTVEDNGIGFESQYFERIMEPFQRLHGRSEYEGTGIGLAICKQIVERHHGQITAQSTPDQGSKFIITLPVRQEQ